MTQDANTTARPYTSAAEITTDMADVRYTGANGEQPDASFVAHVKARLSAAPIAPPAPAVIPGFTSSDEVVEAMKDKRYGSDPAYTAQVKERLKNVDLGENTAHRTEIMFDGKGGWIDTEQQRYAAFAEKQRAQLVAAQTVNVPGVGEVAPFSSREELVAAMRTPEYQRGDALTHAIVRARLSVSNL